MFKRNCLLAVIFLTIMVLLCSCSDSSQKSSGPVRDNTPKVLKPSADGDITYGNDSVSIDASNKSQGYIMVRFSSTSSKILVQITDPKAVEYSYYLPSGDKYQTFPLSGGDGNYSIRVLKNVSGTSYAVAYSESFEVKLEDEFLPFLYPNQYSDFNAESQAVKKAKELAADTHSDLEVIENVYNYVTENVSYDTAKAESVTEGYIPDVDETMKSKTGICFDYASLMTAMLRSQRIPTRLEVGYSDNALHSWISAYTKENGWVDKIIEFDGNSWSLMDPTLAANNSSDKSELKKYMGDGSNYTLKYSY